MLPPFNIEKVIFFLQVPFKACLALIITCAYILCVFLPHVCFPFSFSINSRLASSLGNLHAASDAAESKLTLSSSRTGYSVSQLSRHLNGSALLPAGNDHELNNNLYNRRGNSTTNLNNYVNSPNVLAEEYNNFRSFTGLAASSARYLSRSIPVSSQFSSPFSDLIELPFNQSFLQSF